MDANVVLREQPGRRIAAIRFSGFATQSSLDRHRDEMMARLAKRQEKPIGTPSYAFYDPPWTPPWARRNEIMVEISR